MKSDSRTHGPFLYNGKDAVYRFLANLLYHGKVMKVKLVAKKTLVMTPEDWRRYNSATECHICNESLVKKDSLDV